MRHLQRSTRIYTVELSRSIAQRLVAMQQQWTLQHLLIDTGTSRTNTWEPGPVLLGLP